MFSCQYMAHISFVSSLNLRLNWSWREVKVLSAAADATSSAVRHAPSSTGAKHSKHQAEYSDMTVEARHDIHDMKGAYFITYHIISTEIFFANGFYASKSHSVAVSFFHVHHMTVAVQAG